MNEVVAAHFERARQALHAARVLLETGDASDSISRSYYAALHAARAALACVGESPKTHSGVNNRFWVHFVKAGRVPKKTGQFLSRAQEMREDADYDAFTRFDMLAAGDLLREAEAFIEETEALVKRLTAEGEA